MALVSVNRIAAVVNLALRHQDSNSETFQTCSLRSHRGSDPRRSMRLTEIRAGKAECDSGPVAIFFESALVNLVMRRIQEHLIHSSDASFIRRPMIFVPRIAWKYALRFNPRQRAQRVRGSIDGKIGLV